ncbi:MAG: hypothetical protein M1150_04765 [Patescibacteria group bacterium]|nr:hypothetical protein [Patescibacteria group bacterium]
MFNFSILKIIDEAILPAFLVVGAKIGGVLIVTKLFALDFTLTQSSFFSIPLIGYSSSDSLTVVNTVSSILTTMMVMLGLGWVLIKAHHFHASHIHPKLATKLAQNGLENLIQDSFEIYHQALVWLSLLWFTFFLSVTQFYYGVLAAWAVIAILAFGLILSLIFILDVKKEIDLGELASEDLGKV